MRRELRLRLAALWTDRGTMVRAFDWDQGVTDEPHAASPDPAPPGTGPGRRAGARARAPCAWRRQPARLGALPDDLRAEVAADFDRATALLHSFGYELARQAFAGVAARDPECAMAQWGIAMSLYHPVWAPPSAPELDQGRAAADKAVATGGASERERSYIGAIAALYRDARQPDHRTRAVAYRGAMADVAKRFPEDHEAAIFYALSLLGSAPPNDPHLSQQQQAAEILNRLLPLEPQHPGVAHYLIHALDYPQLASRALPAARAYARIAPASPHAQHMPSHIFTRLG